MHRADSYAASSALIGLTDKPKPRFADVAAPPLDMLLIKPVGDTCNLACTYCYEESRRAKSKSGAISMEEFEWLLDHILPYVQPPFYIYFHGGEPLLWGLDSFARAVDSISRRGVSGWLRLGVQTNATLINRGWARFFRDASINVGVSLDGPRSVHDELRISNNGQGSYRSALRGIQFLQEEGVRFGTISVLSAQHAALAGAADTLFDHFKHIGIFEYDVHPAWAAFGTARSQNVSPRLYADFMIKLFDRWLEENNPSISIRSFEHFFKAMTGILADACYRSGKCTGILGVDPSGDVTPCTRPFDSSYTFGNLIKSPLSEIFRHPKLNEFVAQEKKGRQHNSDCEWSRLCGSGGCPHERTLRDKQAIDGMNIYCTCQTKTVEGYPAIFSHMMQRSETILSNAMLATSAIL